MKYADFLTAVRMKSPLIYCLTNFVTVNDCANVLLAAGASPVMSLDIREAAELAQNANAVLINIGTPSEAAVEAMLTAGEAANQAGVPVILDPVGAGATAIRREICRTLLDRIRFAAIRGNASEIASLAGKEFGGRGVDAGAEVLDEVADAAKSLASGAGCIVAASGAVDVVTDGTKMLFCRNGIADMTRITGSGCMSGALAAGFIGASPEDPYAALAASVLTMGIAGETAGEMLMPGQGTGTLRSNLIDAVSRLDAMNMTIRGRYEEK
ncbi:MAG: hydroxyethylthiazole kinase [Lentisphaeria bacterium]|nr:hydroxyethylthiazole kinase [Lentisphaeria bacterium]